MSDQSTLLSVKNLKTYFYTFEGVAKAVDDVSFDLKKGEILGVVGESGCGKSVTAQTIMKLIPMPPGRIVDGSINFDGIDITGLSMEKMREIRGKRIAMIFQEPMTSLNPVFTIGDQISEMFMLHEKVDKKEAWERSIDMLRKVQIPAPEKRVYEYPHQLSGGMRQRAMIAMALSCNPEILIADEPTTALDVTIQAQILDLMMQLREDFQTAIMMITHDLGVIAEIAERVVVMYAGKVVEEADTTGIFETPRHPYTKGLLKSIPILGERSQQGRHQLHEIKGTVPSLYQLSEGCSFCPRCPDAMDQCQHTTPEMKTVATGHQVRCWLY
ncbi:MAG: ABC transporter ATP-binding protein [Proteobacteria bacterium]|nr:ABC transporter ATP-binding protein [Pseudomonadota bacterium]